MEQAKQKIKKLTQKQENQLIEFAATIPANFDYAYGETPCIDIESTINIPVMNLSEARYNEICENVESYIIEGKGYTVIAFSDSSSYNYWRNMEESNYIMVTATIQDFSKIDFEQLAVDLVKTYRFFEYVEYENG